jgi:UDP-N-acetylmuramoyl-tripeptide--D-alanyl-D-alanine ligase
MIRIGFLQHRGKPHHQAKIYQYAAVAQMEGADLFVFDPGSIDLSAQSIQAWRYEQGHWRKQQEPWPDVVINGSPTISLMRCEAYDRAIQLQRKVPFTCHPVGDKQYVLQLLQQCIWTRAYIPEQRAIPAIEGLEEMMTRHHSLMLKPERGNNGNGISKLTNLPNGWHWQSANVNIQISEDEKREWFEQLVSDNRILAQQYIESITPTEEAFDIRVHVQKDASLRWSISAIHPKIAPPKTYVTNDLQGGSVAIMETFMDRVFGKDSLMIVRKLQTLSLQISCILDETRLSIGEPPLSQLGLDIGIDRTGHPWVYEVNWYPGFPAMLNWHLEVPRKHIQYAMKIARLHHSGKWPPASASLWSIRSSG